MLNIKPFSIPTKLQSVAISKRQSSHRVCHCRLCDVDPQTNISTAKSSRMWLPIHLWCLCVRKRAKSTNLHTWFSCMHVCSSTHGQKEQLHSFFFAHFLSIFCHTFLFMFISAMVSDITRGSAKLPRDAIIKTSLWAYNVYQVYTQTHTHTRECMHALWPIGINLYN